MLLEAACAKGTQYIWIGACFDISSVKEADYFVAPFTIFQARPQVERRIMG